MTGIWYVPFQKIKNENCGGDPATSGADATAITNNNDQKESGITVPKEVSQEGNEETKKTNDKRALDDSCHTLGSLFRGDYYDVPGEQQQWRKRWW